MIRWWKNLALKKLGQTLSEREKLAGNRESAAEMLRETAMKVFGVSTGWRKQDKETQWWNEEVKERIQMMRLVKKKWDNQGDEERKQEY